MTKSSPPYGSLWRKRSAILMIYRDIGLHNSQPTLQLTFLAFDSLLGACGSHLTLPFYSRYVSTLFNVSGTPVGQRVTQTACACL